MEQIKVKISGSSFGKLVIKNTLNITFLLHFPNWKLCCKHKAFPRIALYKSIPGSFFRMTTVIDISRVKIIHAGRYIFIHHHLNTFNVDCPVLFRKTHKSKTKLWYLCQIKCHTFLLL